MGKKALWMSLPSYRKKRETKARQRIRPVSKRISAAKRKYRARVKVWLDENPRCFACPQISPFNVRFATECHHFRGRLGSLLMDERYWRPVCHSCHMYIHGFVEHARRLGLICKEGDWNKPGPQEKSHVP